MTVDLTLCVTAHDETLVAGLTMRSADVAVACAEAEGITVERIIALDTATEGCSGYFDQPRFDAWERRHCANRDLGLTRNEIVRHATGELIAFLDADDLFSENWILEGVRRYREAVAVGERVIVHPELNWLFDGANAVVRKVDQTDPLFSPYFFYLRNYYDSLCIAPRQAHLEIPYLHRDIPNGLSYQDWQFSIESMAAGWRHVIARDTIIFKRRRDTSLVVESRDRSAIVRPLEALHIDRIDALGREPGAAPPDGNDAAKRIERERQNHSGGRTRRGY